MSNRVCLYSTNFVPGTEIDDRRIVGISEWGNDIPLGFKLLVSGNPRKCPSLIWDDPGIFGVIGDYDAGVAHFLQFLERVPHPAVAELTEEARRFLEADSNKNRYLMLEPYEVFCMESEVPGEHTDLFIAELSDLGPQMDKAIAELEARMYEETHPLGFFARLFGARTPVRRETSKDLVHGLGLGGWANCLFFDPNID